MKKIIAMIIVTVAMVKIVILEIPLFDVTAVNSHAVSRSGVCSIQKVADPLAGNTYCSLSIC